MHPTALLLLGSFFLSSPSIGDLIDPSPGQMAVYEGKKMISQKTGETLIERELSLGYTYVMFGSAGGKDRRMLLVRSMAPGKYIPVLPAFSDAGFFRVAEDLQVTPLDAGELDPRQRELDVLIPAAVFPSFDLPGALGEGNSEDEVRVVDNAKSLLPLRSSVVKEGNTVTVERTLEPGKSATVEYSGTLMTVKSFKEVYVIDRILKAVTASTREVHVVSEAESPPVDLKMRTELKATGVHFLEGSDKKNVAALDGKVEDLLIGFGKKQHPRELYTKLFALKKHPGVELVDGLYKALSSRLASYRDAIARKKRANKPKRKVPQRRLRGGGNLVGNEAPDFTLESLEGEKVPFRKATKGKVVLLSFWAKGCGPCRREAPYLSKLQEEFGEKGFTVMAVNGWDESKKVVSRFVKRGNLKQPILLMGGSVAQEQYSVPGFPASFWIDHKGKIVHREVGFRPEDFPAMRKRAAEMLAAAN